MFDFLSGLPEIELLTIINDVINSSKELMVTEII